MPVAAVGDFKVNKGLPYQDIQIFVIWNEIQLVSQKKTALLAGVGVKRLSNNHSAQSHLALKDVRL